MIFNTLLSEFLLCATCLTGGMADAPFVELEYAAALERSMAEGKLLMINFSNTSGGGPDGRMRKETWKNQSVREWVGKNAIAIHVDVYEDAEMVSKFKITSTPTVLFFRGGELFDRHLGFMARPDFLEWARGVRRGVRANDKLLRRSEQLKQSNDLDLRHAVAKDLLAADRTGEALLHYEWLWLASRRHPAWAETRVTVLLPEIVGFCRIDGVAEKAFFDLMKGPPPDDTPNLVPDYEDWKEWTLMCSAFGQRWRIIKWYEGARDERGRLFGKNSLKAPGHVIITELIAELENAKRPQDAVNLLEDPKAYARRMVADYSAALESLNDYSETTQREVGWMIQKDLARQLSTLYGVMLSSEKFYGADGIAKLLLSTSDTPHSRFELVRYGVRGTETAHRYFWRLVNEAESAGGSAPQIRAVLEQLDAESYDMVSR